MAKPRRPTGASRLTAGKPELIVEGSDAAFRQFVHDFLGFAARAEQVRTGFGRALGLSGTAYTILITIAHLADEEDGLGVSRVAEHLHLSGAFVTIEVAKLVEAKLVAKRPNRLDRRRVLLTVTAEGRRLLDELAPLQAQVNDALFDGLSAADFAAMRDMLGRLIPCGDRALTLQAFLMKPAPEPDGAPRGRAREAGKRRPPRRTHQSASS